MSHRVSMGSRESLKLISESSKAVLKADFKILILNTTLDLKVVLLFFSGFIFSHRQVSSLHGTMPAHKQMLPPPQAHSPTYKIFVYAHTSLYVNSSLSIPSGKMDCRVACHIA